MVFNFDDLKASLLLSDSQRDERVEVNQRHLIDKILARYSSEFTIYREVVQNADDAGSSEFEIEFKCKDGQNVTALSFMNNGKPFSKEDWMRLKRIAEGNPDEGKIGFFGVGFYSLFSVCDEPIVWSGDTCLGFNWKGDQLYTRSRLLENKSAQTCIYLDLRQTLQVPDLDEFSEFAGKCLLFTRSLRKISVKVNRELQFSMLKKENGKVSIKNSSPRNRSFSSSNIFKADETILKSDFSLSFEKNYKSATKKDNFLGRFWKTVLSRPSSSESHAGLGNWDIDFSLWNLDIHSNADKSFQLMFERVTKKSPSKKSTLSILMPDLAVSGDKLTHPILKSIVPLESQGKIFIGFETHQTSSAVFHVNGPFIPTVERESLDFVDRTLATWNQDMLVHCGHLLRVLYEQLIEESYLSPYFFKTFAFELSTPSQIPSSIICDAFFTTLDKPLHIPTTKGVTASQNVRLIPDDMISFLKSTPTIYKDDNRWNQVFWENIAHYVHFDNAGAEDLRIELLDRVTLDESEIVAILNWLSTNITSISSALAKDLFQLLIVPVSHSTEMKPLATINFFPTALTKSLPHLPSNCIAPTIWVKCVGLNRLRQLKPLNVIDWFQVNASSKRFKSDPVFIEDIFVGVSPHFPRLNSNEVELVKSICKDLPCMPTTIGLALPSLSFFESVKVLENLPIINFVSRWKVSEELLRALGVKSHLPIPDIMANLKDWDYQSLIKYLVDVQEDLSESELKILATFPIYSDNHGKLRGINELYLANEISKLLNLPLLRWSIDLKEDDRVTEFLFSIGLNTAPSLSILLGAVKSSSLSKQKLIIDYFYKNFARHYSEKYNVKTFDIDCVPTADQDIVKPSQCFTDGRVQVIGFKMIHADFKQYASTFQLEARPSANALVDRLVRVSFVHGDANAVFSLMGSAQHEFSRSHWKVVKEAEFIPVGSGTHWRRPDQVFFRCENHELGYLFHQVDFGPSGNAFLHACGVQDKISVWSVAQMLVNDPDGILGQIGAKSYLHLLKTMALDLHSLIAESPTSFGNLKSHRFLLGVRHRVKSEEETAENEYVVANSSDIFLVDDSISAQLFDLLSAPPGDVFSEFYREMGCLRVSEVVEEKWYFSGERSESVTSAELQKRIQQRAYFLCHGMKAEQRSVLHSALDTLASLQVFEISMVTVSRSFRGLLKESESTACFASDGSILITQDFDYFDVSALLAKVIFADPKMSDSLLLSSFLSMSLKHLQSKGFGLDLFGEPDLIIEQHFQPEMPNITEPVKPISPQPSQPTQPDHRLDRVQKQNLSESETDTQRHSQRKNRHSFADFFGKFMTAIGGDTQKSKSGSQIYDYDSIQRKLAESSRACGEVNQTEFDLSIRGEDGPTISAPAVSHCAIPESRLHFIASVNTVKLFSESSVDKRRIEALLTSNARGIHSFSKVLRSLGAIFGLNQSQLNVFYIPSSTIMAFNRNGCLFFSLDSFLSQQQQQLSSKAVMSSWFVTFAHELAHNFSRNHDLMHGQYMSLYIEHYMEEIHELFLRIEQ